MHCYVYVINMMYYLFMIICFVVDKDKDNITSSVKIGYQKIEKGVYNFLL